jgi:hypothetical protein
VIGDGQGRHAHAGGGGDQLVDAGGAVAEREGGVRVQVDEAHGRIPVPTPYRAAAIGRRGVMPNIGFLELLIGAAIWVGIVVLTAWLAAKKGYSPVLWTVLAIFFTWITLVIVLVLPNKAQTTSQLS